MKRQIPGLHREGRNGDEILEGVFLVRVDRAFYRWHPQRPFYVLRFAILEPKEHQGHSLTGRLYCTPKPCGNSAGSSAISATTPT